MTNLNNLYEEALAEGTGRITAEDLNLLHDLKILKSRILQEFGNDDHLADRFHEIEIRMVDLFGYSNKVDKNRRS